MKKTYKGSCHCGAVKFEADIDLAAGTGRCNCSICAKQRLWAAMVKPPEMRILSGKDNLGDYQFGSKSVHHVFCKTCGVRAFVHGHIKEIGGDFYTVNVACLDGVSDEEFASAKVGYADGRNNNWFNPPAETRHL